MKSGFIIYNDWKDLLDDLSMEDRGRVFTALFDVADGEDPDNIDNPAARMLLKVMTKQMQKDADAYERKCEKNRDNARQRTQANATERKPSLPNATERKPSLPNANERKPSLPNANERKRTWGDNDNDNDNDKENDKDKDYLKDKEKAILTDGQKEKEKVTAAAAATNARKEKFYESLIPFVGTYGKEMIREFFDYWTEPNKSKSQMRYELERTWDLNLRLKTWARRDKPPRHGKTDMSVGVVLHNTDEDYEKTRKQLW